ncbi:phosphoribosyl-AMP cyclohydrolase, partial [Aeromonas hydrophila]|uniref:phosphoribosyl-AMP cyclohydrolase n=1 Tax=Aeromonas hydrophila TaxID=644 RepID=UPI0023AFAC67
MNNQAVNNEQSLAERLDWAKCDGMIPAIVQHAASGEVLMQGFMTREALDKTLTTSQVTFFSRSKQRLWTKGESSGHVLQLVAITTDCDQDSLLIAANPVGPTCH